MSDVTTPAPASQEQPSPLPPCETPPAPPDGAAAPAGAEQPEPETRSLVESVKTLKRFGTLCQQQADGNYRLAETAALYVEQFLGASDKSTRSRAVESDCRAERKPSLTPSMISAAMYSEPTRLKPVMISKYGC